VKAGYEMLTGMPPIVLVSSMGGCVSVWLSCGKWNIVNSPEDSFLSHTPKEMYYLMKCGVMDQAGSLPFT
jgi:hypothetical protein